ncbi:CRISPR-associated helicase/endonuclease Cas3 [Bacillus coahuilensis]|uniref:CRISPR-associated helicase/endonuclease Cas3 n=1 Tax=Bacillus coahuilensis TaxID=408580 RepID=UPI00018510E1|nr:CRISPR-associated helicase/endonuclease Cas3 [Bacillus coahuilensis]
MIYIAHIRESDGEIQTVRNHLVEVKELAENMGEKLGVKHIAGLAGMLHDVGKYSGEFQNYIIEAVENPENPPKRGSVDHSTAGGKLLYDLLHVTNIRQYTGILAEIVGNVIISHHSYLKDFFNSELESDYLKRVRDKELPQFELTKRIFFNQVISEEEFLAYVEKSSNELKLFLQKDSSKTSEFKFMFLTKMIFSILIDADRTNTRLFEENKQYIQQENSLLFSTYYNSLMKKIQAFNSNSHKISPINTLRNELSEQCDAFAEKSSGIYTLSIPTGGGKTFASLRYALKHAKLYDKKRIIYVVPYTTIIEQNAEEIRKILQDNENILEHHSNVVDDLDDNDEDQDGLMSRSQKLKYAKDNWDSPIIFTTMVQFLDVFYAKGSRNIRRLHNLCESVIIFDEVQKVPTHCVSLFNNALNFLKDYGQSSMILCTATQPALDFVEHKLSINNDAEIIEQIDDVVEKFKRTEIIDIATSESFTEDKLSKFIGEQLIKSKNILIILNTKKAVKRLYERLKETHLNVPIYHLSTSMCAAHRKTILEIVRAQLKEGKQLICISTQLIEAGVDISFECVIRSLAGLDSIAQAAGRCNRHGELEVGRVYVVDYCEENLDRLKEISVGKQISRKIFVDLNTDTTSYGGHVLSTKAMARYFQEYYLHFSADLNYYIPKFKKEMTNLLMGERRDNSYRKAFIHKFNIPDVQLFILNSYGSASEYFKVIDQVTTSVVVPYGQGIDIIAQLNSSNSIDDLGKIMKIAQQYSLNLFEHDKRKLIENKGLVPLLDGKIFALTEGAYNKEFGLDPENESGYVSAIY